MKKGMSCLKHKAQTPEFELQFPIKFAGSQAAKPLSKHATRNSLFSAPPLEFPNASNISRCSSLLFCALCTLGLMRLGILSLMIS